jgi:hypothetical protein
MREMGIRFTARRAVRRLSTATGRAFAQTITRQARSTRSRFHRGRRSIRRYSADTDRRSGTEANAAAAMMRSMPKRHYVRRKDEESKSSLIKACRDGALTLVLGAGVSMSRGVPSWETLVRALWAEVRGADLEWLHGLEPIPHPFAYQILLEEILGTRRPEMAVEKKKPVEEIAFGEAEADRHVAALNERYGTHFEDSKTLRARAMEEAREATAREKNQREEARRSMMTPEQRAREDNDKAGKGVGPLHYPI